MTNENGDWTLLYTGFLERVYKSDDPSSIIALTVPSTPLSPFLEECAALYDGDIITDQDYIDAATTIGCEVAAVKAVAKKEGGVQGAFRVYKNKTLPTILYERHHFRSYTNGQYNSQPDLSGNQGNYGVYSAQYPKLEKAMLLNQAAALKSCSWGKFQILASNFSAAGYSGHEEMIKDYSRNERRQLLSFAKFINADSVLKNAMIQRNWTAFALRYNGAGAPSSYGIGIGTNYTYFTTHPNENP